MTIKTKKVKIMLRLLSKKDEISEGKLLCQISTCGHSEWRG